MTANESTPLLFTNTSNHHEHKRENSIQSGLNDIQPLPRMEIQCHAITKDGICMENADIQEALQDAKRSGRNHYWIDIDADHHEDDSNELREWFNDGLHLPNYVIDLLSEPPEQWASQVVPLQRAALVVIRILPEHYKSSDQVVHVAALQTRSLLFTFSSCPRSETGGYAQAAVLAHMDKRGLSAPTNSGALLAWLHYHVDRTSRYTRELRYAVLAMDEAMDRDTTTAVPIEELIAAKDQLLRLLSVAEEQNECLESLAGVASSAESGTNDAALDLRAVRGSLSILLATAASTERTALRLEKNLGDLRQRHEDHDQQVMNRRLGVLTVFSAVFLPLTLLTGLWGMNFQDMPELSKPYAYPMALLFMFTIAIAMICYFQRTGWFD